MRVHNLLSLLHLLTKHIKEKQPLIDYSQSHIVTNFEYLNILRSKVTEKEIVEEIKEGK
jgi:hypothetical protein